MNEPIPSDTEALRAALAAEQQARREAEARASGAEAMVAHLKLLIAKMKRDRFGASAERGRFIWPTPTEGSVAITGAQLGYMLDGIDWRNPRRTWRPEVAG